MERREVYLAGETLSLHSRLLDLVLLLRDQGKHEEAEWVLAHVKTELDAAWLEIPQEGKERT